ncbi:MAG: primosomal protein N' [Patescibacteria group bacterium]|nr:primosomal protein N' [Patescibacteria group bacterium]
MKKNKIAQIIPALRLKRDLHFFDYEIPKELEGQAQVGQLVEIPFRNQLIKGVILNLLEKESEFELKPIAKILEPFPYLKLWQLNLIKDLAAYYFVSMGILLKMIIPDIPKRAKNSAEKFLSDFKFEKLKHEIKTEALESTRPVLLRYFKLEDKYAAYLDLIKKVIEQKKRVAIICPQLLHVKKIYQYLGDFKDSTSIFLNDLPMNKYFQEYRKIKDGTTQIIIGTRSAIFAPFSDLGLIIIDEEENENHKQEEPNPRYNAKTVALKISELTGAKVIFSTAAPSLWALNNVENKEWAEVKIKAPSFPELKIIDKKEEFKAGRYELFSDELAGALKKNLANKQQSFLFLNRKGTSTMATCKDCGKIVSCPACKLPLVYYASKKMLCHNCGHEQDLVLFCSECKSPNIKLTGTGTEKVETEVKKIFPKAKAIKLDIATPNYKKDLSGYDIIIGTQFALDYINWEKISLVGVVSADTLFYLPDFRSQERTFDLLARMALFLGEGKKMIVQTFTPDNYVFKALSEKDFKIFYKNEIAERQDLNYPPITKLVKIIGQSYEFNAGQEEIEEVYKNLKKTAGDKIIILSPALIYSQQVRGRFRWQIIIKLLDRKTSLDFLKIVPDNLIIDVEPESLL